MAGAKCRTGQNPQCSPAEICNPRTNRCVKIQGKIGQRLLSQSTPPKQPSPTAKPVIQVIRHRDGGITYRALPHAQIGDTQVIGGQIITIVNTVKLRQMCRDETQHHKLPYVCTTRVKNMYMLFFDVQSVAFNQPIGAWDTSNVADMEGIFYGARAFNQSIANWDTGKVKTMQSMFRGAQSFNQPIGNWNTRKVWDMTGMFNGAVSFNQPIGGWNTSNVAYMREMFKGAQAFNQPIGNWNTGKVTEMDEMFYGAISFNQPIGGWDTSNVYDMMEMFRNARAFNQDLSRWDIRAVQSTTIIRESFVNAMFEGATSMRAEYVPRFHIHTSNTNSNSNNSNYRQYIATSSPHPYNPNHGRLRNGGNALNENLMPTSLNTIPENKRAYTKHNVRNGKLDRVYHVDFLRAMFTKSRQVPHPYNPGQQIKWNNVCKR